MAQFPSPALVGFADIRRQAIDDWPQYLLAGQQFLGLAERAHHARHPNFTPEILFNLITMAIEKLVMSALMRIGRLPDNHTLHDLTAALETWLPDTVRDQAAALRSLDSFQEICDPYASSTKTPSLAEIDMMLALARQLEQRLEAAVSP